MNLLVDDEVFETREANWQGFEPKVKRPVL
jgi:hypothetical protein